MINPHCVPSCTMLREMCIYFYEFLRTFRAFVKKKKCVPPLRITCQNCLQFERGEEDRGSHIFASICAILVKCSEVNITEMLLSKGTSSRAKSRNDNKSKRDFEN